MGAAVKAFRYGRDPICLIAIGGYVVNQSLLKPQTGSPFFQGYFNDVLLIPAALPIVLWVQVFLGLRTGDAAPTWSEIAGHGVLWALIAEFVGPTYFHRGVSDPWDLLAYLLGGIASGLWWHRQGKPEISCKT